MERKIKSLSWSKINSFLEFPKQFIKTYFEEEPFFETKEIIFGKVMSAFLELNSYNFDEIINHISKDRQGNITELEKWKVELIKENFSSILDNDYFLEKISDFQFNLFPDYEVYLQKCVNKICCLGFIDNAKADLTEFREFKTGKTAWSQEKAENHGQIYFYAMLIEEQTGFLPKKCYLDWIETEDDTDGNIIPTGKIQTFEVEIKKEKVDELRKKLPKIFDDMQKLYEKWLEENEGKMSVNIDLMQKYYELEIQKNAIETEQKEIKAKIDEDLQKNKVDNFKLEGIGSFYYMQRKKYSYSDDILAKEKEIKELKTEFEKSNEPEISQSLSFRAVK